MTQDRHGRGPCRTACLGSSLLPTCGTKASKHGPGVFQNSREAVWIQSLEVHASSSMRCRPSTSAIPQCLRNPPRKEAPCGKSQESRTQADLQLVLHIWEDDPVLLRGVRSTCEEVSLCALCSYPPPNSRPPCSAQGPQ